MTDGFVSDLTYPRFRDLEQFSDLTKLFVLEEYLTQNEAFPDVNSPDRPLDPFDLKMLTNIFEEVETQDQEYFREEGRMFRE